MFLHLFLPVLILNKLSTSAVDNGSVNQYVIKLYMWLKYLFISVRVCMAILVSAGLK